LARIILRLSFGLVLALGTAGQAEPTRPSADALAREAAAILAEHCVSCHGPGQAKGGLDLSRRTLALKGGKSGAVIVPGSVDESLLIDKVSAGEMPPKGRLAEKQIDAVRAWVEAGAPYASEPISPRRAGADWWSLRPVASVKPPSSNSTNAFTPIDAFIAAKLSASGLAMSRPADPATLIRRVTFDLLGLPALPEEVEAFVASSRADPLAYEKLVDRLLASPQYGERWGRHWLDVVRFAESQGYETNLPRSNAWPYRDYVIRAFNRDTPYTRFVFEQLAGDVDESSDWLTQAATGFLVGGTHDIVGNQTIEGSLQQRADDLDDIITATGTTFLGLTVQCARCHDHKFDPIGQADYYGIQAIFAGVNHGERSIPAPDAEIRQRLVAAIDAELTRIDKQLDQDQPLARPDADAPARPMVNSTRNVERFPPIKARMVRMAILATSDRSEPCIDELEVFTTTTDKQLVARNVALDSAGGKAEASSEYPGSAIHKIVHLNDGRVGNGRSWISKVPGKGSVTISWPEPVSIDKIVWGRDRDGVYRDRLATDYYIEVALEPGQWRVVASSLDRAPYGAAPSAAAAPSIASSAARERAELTARQAELRIRRAQFSATMNVYAGTFTQPGPTHLLVRGDPTKKGQGVRPAAIGTIMPPLVLDPQSPENQRRAALARWLADPANPLPPRVLVNRLWQYHFGRGIVATPSDFGFNGAPPSHPELLDWLAAAFVTGGWRVKPIQRLIVTSAAYRQSSEADPKALAVDRDNHMLWRMSPRRLEAETLRDAILATSGQLDTRMGGPGYNIWEPNSNYVAVYKPRSDLGPDAFRRMIYQFKPRSQGDPTFAAFDCPDGALVAPRRNVSTTALQALNLLNSRFILQQSRYFAERLEREAGPDPAQQAERGFRLAFGRGPSSAERALAIRLIESHGCAAFCRALYNANEFIHVP
jgi:mono/diheme cytochrome c family protein